MIKFFKHIRKKVLIENRFGKYLIYAFGEIILVVIGILIALQINNWNIERQTELKEQAYLKEMGIYLQRDSLSLIRVMKFNTKKAKFVDEMLQIFTDTLTNKERFEIFNKNANEFTFYEVFDPVRIAFNNMLSAENIDLIANPKLREALSRYYNYPYLDGVQNRIIVVNRRIVDEHYPKFFSKEFVQEWMGISSKMPPLSELDIATDKRLMSDLFGLKMIIIHQNELISNTQNQNVELIALINSNLNKH